MADRRAEVLDVLVTPEAGRETLVTMTLDEIKQLIEFIKAHDLSEFELEHDGVKIRIKSGGNYHHAMAAPQMQASMPMMPTAPMAAPVAAPAAASAVPAGDRRG